MKEANSSNSSAGLVFKKSNVRIWIHQRDLGNLQKVVWEGHGSKLLVEHSNNPKIRRFLEAVPHIMVSTRHTRVLLLLNLKRKSFPPGPRQGRPQRRHKRRSAILEEQDESAGASRRPLRKRFQRPDRSAQGNKDFLPPKIFHFACPLVSIVRLLRRNYA